MIEPNNKTLRVFVINMLDEFQEFILLKNGNLSNCHVCRKLIIIENRRENGRFTIFKRICYD